MFSFINNFLISVPQHKNEVSKLTVVYAELILTHVPQLMTVFLQSEFDLSSSPCSHE